MDRWRSFSNSFSSSIWASSSINFLTDFQDGLFCRFHFVTCWIVLSVHEHIHIGSMKSIEVFFSFSPNVSLYASNDISFTDESEIQTIFQWSMTECRHNSDHRSTSSVYQDVLEGRHETLKSMFFSTVGSRVANYPHFFVSFIFWTVWTFGIVISLHISVTLIGLIMEL